MHQVERTCISLRQFRHNLVIVIGDGALADADQTHCSQQPDRIAACEQHAHADAGAGGQQNKRLFQPEIQRQKACTETGYCVADRLHRQQHTAHLIIQGIVRLEHRQNRAEHDKRNAQCKISKKQVKYDIPLVFSNALKERLFVFHLFCIQPFLL